MLEPPRSTPLGWRFTPSPTREDASLPPPEAPREPPHAAGLWFGPDMSCRHTRHEFSSNNKKAHAIQFFTGSKLFPLLLAHGARGLHHERIVALDGAGTAGEERPRRKARWRLVVVWHSEPSAAVLCCPVGGRTASLVTRVGGLRVDRRARCSTGAGWASPRRRPRAAVRAWRRRRGAETQPRPRRFRRCARSCRASRSASKVLRARAAGVRWQPHALAPLEPGTAPQPEILPGLHRQDWGCCSAAPPSPLLCSLTRWVRRAQAALDHERRKRESADAALQVC